VIAMPGTAVKDTKTGGGSVPGTPTANPPPVVITMPGAAAKGTKPSDGSVPSTSATNATPEIARVSTKLPSFWEDSPAAWFAAAEAEFDVSNVIRERTRYSYLISALPKDVLKKVMDVVSTPSQDQPYTYLKTQLLERLTISEEQRISQLLYHVEMGDRSPSEFYRHMVQLAGNSANLTTELIRKLWLSRLPKTIEVTLIAIDARDINELLRIADRLWETTQAGTVAAVASGSSERISRRISENQNTEFLKQEIEELRRMIENLSRRSRSSSRGRPRNDTRGKRYNRSQSRRQHSTCYYHHRFGEAARKCLPPCDFGVSRDTSSNPSVPKN